MTGMIMKLIICPITLIALSMLMPAHINYPNILYPILIGVLIAIAGFGMEVMFLKHGTVWASTFLDFLGAGLITYISQYAVIGAYISYWGAAITGLVVAVIEHFMHIHLINSGKIDSDGNESP